MGLFANPDLGSWLSDAGTDLGNGLSDVASGAQNLGSSLMSGLGFGAPAAQVDPTSQLQSFYNLGASTPTSISDWYNQAAQQIPALTGAVTPTFAQGLTALGNALSPSTPASPMAMPSSGSNASVAALGQSQQQAGSAASSASSAAQTAQAALGSGITATAPRFASPTVSRPNGLQFVAGFGAPIP